MEKIERTRSSSLENEKHGHTTTQRVVVQNMFTNAASATEKEHKMSILQGVRLYPKAIIFSVIISLCCAMEGYDIALLGNFYAFPPFNRKYGELQSDGTYQVPAAWQAGISNGAQCGQIIGLFLTGWGVEKFGYKKFILTVFAYQACIITIFFFAPSIHILLVGACFAGIAFGVFMSAPESPWWLVRQGRYEDAKKSLLRLTSPKTDPTFSAEETVDMMRHTNELEKDMTEGASYLDCFKGVNLRRTEIVCMLFVSQNLAGNTFSNYSTYFFAQAGLTGTVAYDFAMGQYGLNTIGAFVTWAFMAWGVGRRTLFLVGLSGLCCTLLILGFLGLVPEAHKDSAALATGSMMIVWAAFYQFSVGTVAFSLVAEMSTRRLQVKTVALSRIAYNIAAIIVNVLTPYMLNPTAWNWGNFAGFFWAGTCFLMCVYHYYRLPEPSGRTFAEMDLLFERRIPARQFKHTDVNAFDVALQHQVREDKPGVEHHDRV
ncbi:hypothetical protein LTR05_008779 [Lithohypha guttulata]|uniref:Major facilitator superfamily (MFS) profile domain-containing protein n=1 Tax=Lithohypha guttulata TaxID=1690604 RepID=A0AAN7PH79_9EURO|nr:hypothetical protein LTR05_008779 [Lithohypha guttulata]